MPMSGTAKTGRTMCGQCVPEETLWTMRPWKLLILPQICSTPTSLLLLLYSYFSAKCTHCICFDMESTMVLNCFRVVISGRMGKQMYFMPRENPEDEVEMKPKIICSTTQHLFSAIAISPFQLVKRCCCRRRRRSRSMAELRSALAACNPSILWRG